MLKPHSIATISLSDEHDPPEVKAAKKKAREGWAGRHGYHWPKGTVLPETRRLACPRVRVADLPPGHLKQNHIDRLEQNQLIASCCRHPENHEVEAHKSHPEESAPDIYIFTCTCGKKHRFFCLGREDERPIWAAS